MKFTEGTETKEVREIFKDLLNRQLKQGTEIAGSDDWLYDTVKYRFDTALLVEVAELIEHTPWKWWKHNPPAHLTQVQLELVDILHFGLSRDLQDCCKNFHGEQALVGFLANHYHAYATSNRDNTRPDPTYLLRGRTWNPEVFFKLCEEYDLPLRKLHRLYVAKGVLNLFRQGNGYKEGTYVKTWEGREDNTYLTDIVQRKEVLGADIELAEEMIYTALEEIYRNVVATPV